VLSEERGSGETWSRRFQREESGEKKLGSRVTVRERTEWAVAGLAGLGCSVHFFFPVFLLSFYSFLVS
jgi:hypothetical protein